MEWDRTTLNLARILLTKNKIKFAFPTLVS